MENITIYPKNEKQKSLLTSLLEEMKIRYEVVINKEKSSFTEDEFIAKIDKSLKQAASGKTKKLEKDQQKEFFRFMIYALELTDEAISDIAKHKKVGDKKVLIKIDKLLNELREHPTKGTGKPEKLKHYEIATWSRRITDKHRLIYRIEDEKVIVIVLAFWGHYSDK